jgi:hypothetical protein
VTLKQALDANVKIEPGHKVKTFGGWCRRDLVTIGGNVIGGIQTRRGRGGRAEVITFAGDSFLKGYNVDWLVGQSRSRPGNGTGRR